MGRNRNAVAFLGLGSMGSGMAHRLLDTGFTLTVHSRTAAKAAPLVAAGAQRAASAALAVDGARTVVLSLSDEKAVEQVLFGELAGKLPTGTVVVDTSTISPGYSRSACERLGRSGIRRVEACALGNPHMARAGKLRILSAGDRADVDAAQDVLMTLGQEVSYVGRPGMACALKLAFNMLLGAQIVSLAEAVSLAEEAGLDRDVAISALVNSGFSSPTLAFRAEFMRTRRYQPPAFRAALMEKDLRLAMASALEHGLKLPVTERAAERFAETVAAGGGDQDASAVFELQRAETRR